MFSRSTIAPALAALAAAAALTLGLSAGAASTLAQRPPSSGGNTGDNGGYAVVAMAGFQTITEAHDPTGTGGSQDPGH
jgi:hypothetical protein